MPADNDGLQFTDFDLADTHTNDDQKDTSRSNYNPISQITKPENFEFEFEPDEDINDEDVNYNNSINDEIIPDIINNDVRKTDSEELSVDNNVEWNSNTIDGIQNRELINDDEELYQGYFDDLQIISNNNLQKEISNIEFNNSSKLDNFSNNEFNSSEIINVENKDIDYSKTETNTHHDHNSNLIDNKLSEEEAEDILAQVLAQDYTTPVAGFEEFAKRKKESELDVNNEDYLPEDLNFKEDNFIESEPDELINNSNITDIKENNIAEEIDISDIINIDERLDSDITEIHNLLTNNEEKEEKEEKEEEEEEDNEDEDDEELNLANLDNLIENNILDNNKDQNSVSEISETESMDEIIEKDNDFDLSIEDNNDLLTDNEIDSIFGLEENEDDFFLDDFDISADKENDLLEIEEQESEVILKSEELEENEEEFVLEDFDLLSEDEEDLFNEGENDIESAIETGEIEDIFLSEDFSLTSEGEEDLFNLEENNVKSVLDSDDIASDYLVSDLNSSTEEEEEISEIDNENSNLESINEKNSVDEFDFDIEDNSNEFEDIDFSDNEFDLIEDIDISPENEFYEQLSDYEKEELTSNTQKYLIKLRNIIKNLPDTSKEFTQKTKEYLQKLKEIKNEIKKEGIKPTFKKYLGQTQKFINNTAKNVNHNLKSKIRTKNKSQSKLENSAKIKLDDWNENDSGDTWGLGPVAEQQQLAEENEVEENNESDWEEDDISFSTADMLMEDIDLDLGDISKNVEQIDEQDKNIDYTGVLGKCRKIKKVILKWGKLIYKFLDSIIDFEKNWWKVVDFFAVIVLVSALAMVAAYYIWHR